MKTENDLFENLSNLFNPSNINKSMYKIVNTINYQIIYEGLSFDNCLKFMELNNIYAKNYIILNEDEYINFINEHIINK